MNRYLENTLERTARILSQRAGVKVICKGNVTPQTNGKTIFLPALPTPCPESIERVWHGVCDHEVGHVLFTDFTAVHPFRQTYGEHGFQVLNALEDLRIEGRMEQEYPGCRENFHHAYADMESQWAEKAPSLPLWPRVIGCLITTGKGMSTDIYGEDARRIVSVVADLIADAIHAASTEAIAVLAEEVLDRWKGILGSMAANSLQEPNSQKGLVELLGDVKSEDIPSLGQHLTALISQTVDSNADMPYRIYDRSLDVVETAPDGDITSYRDLLEQVRPHVSGLRQKLLSTLRAKSQNQLAPSQNGTILNKRKLHQICLDAPCSPFMTKTEATSNDVALSLLIDQSGSMAGQKIQLAQQCAILLAETMSQLELPLEVIGFSTRYSHSFLAEMRKTEGMDTAQIEKEFARYLPTWHVIYKSFREPFRKCRGRFATMAAQHYTPLNESVLLAGKRLMDVRTSRRILIVLTDGSVYLGTKETTPVAQRNLQDNLALLHKAGIEVIAIGIKTGYVQDVFPRSIVVEDLSQLPIQFYQLLSRKLIEGGR